MNRGFAVLGDRLFMATLDAHLIALDMKTGSILYDVELANYRLGYSATVAPLVVKDKVIVGIASSNCRFSRFVLLTQLFPLALAQPLFDLPEQAEDGRQFAERILPRRRPANLLN